RSKNYFLAGSIRFARSGVDSSEDCLRTILETISFFQMSEEQSVSSIIELFSPLGPINRVPTCAFLCPLLESRNIFMRLGPRSPHLLSPRISHLWLRPSAALFCVCRRLSRPPPFGLTRLQHFPRSLILSRR